MTHEEIKKQSIRKRAEAVLDSKHTQMYGKLQTLTLNEVKRIIHELEVHQVELEMQNEDLLTTQNELQRTQKRYFDLYNKAPVGYCTLNQDGVIQEVNLVASKLLGIKGDILINEPLTDFIFKEDQDAYYIYRKKLISFNEQQECELRMIKTDKTPFWVHLTALEETNTDETFVLRLVITDISERKKMEQALKEKEDIMLAQSKQAAMGDMIAMIAHQWRQPLTVISMDVNNLKASVKLGEEITTEDILQHADTIHKQLHQLSETIDNFRNFFKPDQSKEHITIEDALNDTLNIIGTSLKNNNITLHIKNTVKTSLFINKSSLIQVLLNLIGNAKDILLAKEIAQAKINITIHEDKKIITISICDNAGGIPESIMNKIGQPYFTTKEELNGTGLGLYISKTITEKHLFGTLKWYNEDKGACFVLTINLKHSTEMSPLT